MLLFFYRGSNSTRLLVIKVFRAKRYLYIVIYNDIVLASSAGGPGFNLQSRSASYQRRYTNGTSSALV